jgi:hypothetical protein
MTNPTEHQLSLIDDIIDEFNFEKVHKAMIALDWKWAIPQTTDYNGPLKLQVPTLNRLKEFARYQLISSIKTGLYSSGGLKAEYFSAIQEEVTEGGAIKQYAEPEYFVLTFELTSACSLSEYDD